MMDFHTLLSFITSFFPIILGMAVVFIICFLIPGYVVVNTYRRKMDKIANKTGLNPYSVPYRLRAILPIVCEWGHYDEEIRMSKRRDASPNEIITFSETIVKNLDYIQNWLMKINDKPFTPEAIVFDNAVNEFHKSNFIVDLPSQGTEIKSPILKRTSFLESNEGFRSRSNFTIIKIPFRVIVLFFVMGFIGYFILFGILWNTYLSHMNSDNGLILVNILSSIATVGSFGITIGVSRLLRFINILVIPK